MPKFYQGWFLTVVEFNSRPLSEMAEFLLSSWSDSVRGPVIPPCLFILGLLLSFHFGDLYLIKVSEGDRLPRMS